MREKTGGRAEYRSAIRSRRMIREAYTVLLKEKDLSKITVTDIVNRADINRATFYVNEPKGSFLLYRIRERRRFAFDATIF